MTGGRAQVGYCSRIVLYADLRARLAPHVDLVDLSGRTGHDLALAAPDLDVLVHYPPAEVDDVLLDALPRLRAVMAPGAGFDGIDVAAATGRGLLVTHQAGRNARAVAEHTIGLVLSLLRRITEGDRLLRAGSAPVPGSMVTHEAGGRTIGVVGLGAIGARTAQMARDGLGMRVLAHDPHRHGPVPEGIEEVGLQELLMAADVVSLHVPLTPGTAGMIGADELSRMRSTAVLVNTARGGLVDQDALVAALGAGQIAGAGLDVVAGDELPQGHPLLAMDHVVLTPHCAGVTVEAQQAMAERQAAAVLDVLAGRVPTDVGVVDPAAAEAFSARCWPALPTEAS